MKLKILLLLLFAVTAAASAQMESRKYCLDEGVGLGGYDPLSYFQGDSPVKGSESIAFIYDDVIYHFSEEANREEFKKDPEKYLPAYGGWCSMTLVMGEATQPVYENFLIKDDQLYLFERTLSVNGRTLWVQDHNKHKKIAKGNYDQYVETGKIE